eukprot:scaffold8495_cov125-Skeletonema_menzelii.AAC.1
MQLDGGTILPSTPTKSTMNLHMQVVSDRLFKGAAGRDRRRMAMTDLTNVLIAGMSPPNIVRTMNTSDDFENILHAPTSSVDYQDYSPPRLHRSGEQQTASHRRLRAMDWDDIVSTTQTYSSDDGVDNDSRKPTPTRQFEQSHVNKLSIERTSRSSEFLSTHSTLRWAQKYPALSSSFKPSSPSKQLQSRDRHCSQNYQNTTKPSFIVPPNISELISDLNAKAKLLSREEDEYNDSSSLEYSSDDSMIEAAIYKSVAPHPPIRQQQEQSMGGASIKDLICAVCLDFPVDPKQIASVSGCNHRFCFVCIENWAKRGKNDCPLCKSTFHLVASGTRVRWY